MPCGGGAGAGGGSRSRENQDQREDAAAPSAKRGRQRKPPTGNPVLGGGACPDRGADAARGAGASAGAGRRARVLPSLPSRPKHRAKQSREHVLGFTARRRRTVNDGSPW